MEAKNLPLIYTRKDNRNQTGSRQFPFLPRPDIHRVENKRGILFLSKARFFGSLCNDLTLLFWLLQSYCNFLTTYQYFLSFLFVCFPLPYTYTILLYLYLFNSLFIQTYFNFIVYFSIKQTKRKGRDLCVTAFKLFYLITIHHTKKQFLSRRILRKFPFLPRCCGG